MQFPAPRAELLMALATFAQTLQDTLTQLDLDWRQRPLPDEWSLTEVLCHLRDVEREVHHIRFRAILTQDVPFMPGAVTDEWVQLRNYAAQDGPEALNSFLIARQKNILLLTELEEEAWQRYGRHAFFGPTTLHELVDFMTKHDAAHLEQIQKLMAA
ncbi:MAG: DinB family protein [Anaerolineales bacterium]|nr:DinB family protein [Anaerolineales bacterium]